MEAHRTLCGHTREGRRLCRNAPASARQPLPTLPAVESGPGKCDIRVLPRTFDKIHTLRLWSIHPQYLDPAGLVALWREALLAQAVLAGVTRGYRSHPQLHRFREQRNPSGSIARYLRAVANEADARNYQFDRHRIATRSSRSALSVTEGQLLFEWSHLRVKLGRRNPRWSERLDGIDLPLPHPCFQVIPGEVAEWERGASRLRISV